MIERPSDATEPVIASFGYFGNETIPGGLDLRG
jgi:hypothetical protein